jgi:glycerophosphoryl diester phosphodiesterase
MSMTRRAPSGYASGRPAVVNVAHRGASAYAPENTLAAVRNAIGHNSDMVEVDVRRSRDGALVLLHDTTLTRTTNVRKVYPRRSPWLLSDFTLDELRKLDAGSWKAPQYAGERIPTLDELLDVLDLSGMGVLLELKAPTLYPGIVAEVTAALQVYPDYLASARPAQQVVVQSFDHDAMFEHKALDPSIPVGLLGAPPAWRLPSLGGWADQVNAYHRGLSGEYVAAVHEQDMKCFAWTVNRVSDMQRALRAEVDGLITDRPAVLVSVLERAMTRSV